MANADYRCNDCDYVGEHRLTDANGSDIDCPDCGREGLKRVYSAPNAKTSRKSSVPEALLINGRPFKHVGQMDVDLDCPDCGEALTGELYSAVRPGADPSLN